MTDAQIDLIDFDTLPVDEERGTLAMKLFIATEAALFVVLFFAYFYTGHAHPPWPPDAPELTMPFMMLAILLTSSGTIHLAELALQRGLRRLARVGIGVTVTLGLAFIGVQVSEYRERFATLRPTLNAYGSLFYTITGFHMLHVLLGLCMLGFVLVLPRLEPADKPPHRPLHNAALYWHFVDVVWLVLVTLLYLLPHLGQLVSLS